LAVAEPTQAVPRAALSGGRGILVIVAAGLLLLVGPDCYVVGKHGAAALAVASWLALLLGAAPNLSPLARLVLGAVAGISGAALSAISPEQWLVLSLAIALRLILLPFTRRDALTLSAAYVVPLLLFAASLLPGMGDARHALLQALSYAAAPVWLLALHVAAIASALFWFSMVGASAERDPRAIRRASATISLSATLGLAIAVVKYARLIAAEITVPSDILQWSEPPLLMNVLKMARHVPLYGPRTDVQSFTYSPTVELLQAALLSPFHLSLDIVAHRTLVLGWQLATSAIVAWALRPFLGGHTGIARVVRTALVAIACLMVQWASPASPFLHPDHAVHATVAAAIALLLGQDRLPRWLHDAGLVVLPVAATAFKLTGAGVGLGLVLATLYDRKVRHLALLAVAAILALATVPLYDHLFGDFSGYAIVLMSKHHVFPSKLWPALTGPPGRVMLIAGALAFATPGDALRQRDARRLALFMVGLGAITGLAFVKEGGRENNLVAPTLPALAIIVVSAMSSKRSASYAAVSSLVALTGIVLSPERRLMVDPVSSGIAMADHRVAVDFVRAELRAHRHPLVHTGTTIWVDAGGPGIPRDLLHPAIELLLAGDPAFQTHLTRLSSGIYDSIATVGGAFTAELTRNVDLGAAMRRAVTDRYCVVYPSDVGGRPAPLTDAAGRLVILRRKDLGCAPLR